eukprot:754287-Hanusia_phi.AAC.1
MPGNQKSSCFVSCPRYPVAKFTPVHDLVRSASEFATALERSKPKTQPLIQRRLKINIISSDGHGFAHIRANRFS